MTSSNNDKKDKSLDVSKTGKLQLSKTLDTSRMKAMGSGGRAKAVTVEVRRGRNAGGTPRGGNAPVVEVKRRSADASDDAMGGLSEDERALRMQVLEQSKVDAKRRAEEDERRKAEEAERKRIEDERRQRELEESRKREEERKALGEPEVPAEVVLPELEAP
ncbi:MAG: translation initiation factor IF-2 associated domain-containing protein, partial [Alphaproteobacteria bacterium]|nr:translation initiation factor IF-2 associated domain-containing protein [Alphaproteobacteria bacterium]